MKNRNFALLSALEPRLLMSTVSVGNLTVNENAGPASFVLTLDSAQSTDTKISYSTKNGTAKAGHDYTATKNTVTIPAGSTAATVTVPIIDNNTYDGDRTFKLSLKSLTSGVKVGAPATATIHDNESVPTVTASDTTLVEGNKGTTKGTVTVTLSAPASKTTLVSYASADPSNGEIAATKSKDYTPVKGTLKFKAGQTSTTIKVNAKGDTLKEADEVYDINFTAKGVPAPATVSGFSRVIIKDDDAGVTRANQIHLAGGSATAGGDITFTATLDNPATLNGTAAPVSMRYSTALNSGANAATASQFTPVSGVLVIPAGHTSATITVHTTANSVSGSAVSFKLNLSDPANGVLAQSSANGIINSPESQTQGVQSLSVNNAANNEGTPSFPKSLQFEIDLSAASTEAVTVDYSTKDTGNTGDAVAGVDYTPVHGTVTFLPGVTTLFASVPIIPNNATTFRNLFLDITNAHGATITDAEAIGTIIPHA